MLRYVSPAQFELVERAKFHTLVQNPTKTVRHFIARTQRNASTCNLQEHLDVALAEINKIKLH